MTNNLSDFQTILWPAVKTSNVGFYKKPSAGFTSGQVIEAPFTRAGAGRKVIDAAGNLVDAAANVPAWTFPIGGSSAGCPYLSFLPSVENLYTYSEQFDNAAWSKTRLTVTANATTSPDGTVNAEKLIASVDNNTHFLFQSIACTSGVDYTFSFFVKEAEYSRIQFLLSTSGSVFDSSTAIFNASTGVFDAVGAGNTVNVVDMQNGWYSVGVTQTAAASASGLCIVRLDNGTSETFAGNASDGIFIYGGQAKEGSYISPLDYVKTEASAVTRSGDNITAITDLQGDGYLSSTTEGAALFQIGFNGLNNANVNSFTFEDGSGTDLTSFITRTIGLGLYDYVNTTYAVNFDDGDFGELNRILLSWSGSELKVYVNGFLVYTSASAGSFDIQVLNDMDSNNIGEDLKMLNFAPTALTASQAEAASSWPSFDLMVSDLGYS